MFNKDPPKRPPTPPFGPPIKTSHSSPPPTNPPQTKFSIPPPISPPMPPFMKAGSKCSKFPSYTKYSETKKFYKAKKMGTLKKGFLSSLFGRRKTNKKKHCKNAKKSTRKMKNKN